VWKGPQRHEHLTSSLRVSGRIACRREGCRSLPADQSHVASRAGTSRCRWKHFGSIRWKQAAKSCPLSFHSGVSFPCKFASFNHRAKQPRAGQKDFTRESSVVRNQPCPSQERPANTRAFLVFERSSHNPRRRSCGCGDLSCRWTAEQESCSMIGDPIWAP